MAQLDIQGFITPEQQFTGLTKLGETLATQQAAKRKEQEAKDANKKLLNKVVEDIDPKDFMTTTIEDGVITNKIYNLKKEASDFIAQNPNVDQNQLNGWLANKTRGIATASQNIKEIKRKADNAWEEIKANPSADKNKYYKEWNKMFMNPDGSIKEDIESIDPTQDYTTQILTNGDIWNDSAIYAAIDKSQANPLSYKNKTLYRDPTGKSVLSDVEYAHSEFYAPEKDETGHFTNKFRPANYKKATDASGNVLQVPKLDAMGNPMVDKQGNTIMEDQNIIGDEAWLYFKEGNPETKPVINRKLINYGLKHNVDPGGIEAENAVRHELFNQFDFYPKKAKASIVAETKSPVTINKISTGGKADGEVPFNPIYQKLDKIGNDLLSGNNKENKKYNFIPINKLPGDVADAVKLSYAGAMGREPKEITTAEFAINKLSNGEWGLFSAENGRPVGNVVKTLSEDELNLGAAKGKERKPILKDETKLPGYINKNKTSQTYKLSNGKSYTHKQLIDMGYTDEQIKQALNSGTIKTK